MVRTPARDEPPLASARLRLLRILLAASSWVLVAATWQLWIPRVGPPLVATEPPQVPLFAVADRIPDAWQWVALAAMLIAAAMQCVARSARTVTASLLVFAMSACVLFAADQARLQPWAYEFVILALLVALADSSRALVLVRWFIASFYVYSALTKFDFTFLHTLGQQFLEALAGTLGASVDSWSPAARLAAAAVFPAGELAIGVALLVPRLRRAAVIGAVVLHLVLLAILGPWGLDHRPGVLLWNAYFIVQDVLLFWPWTKVSAAQAAAEIPTTNLSTRSRVADRAASAVATAAIVLPLLGPTGWFDHWPSWGLYAPNAERTLLMVHRRAVDDLPTALAAFCQGDDATEPWLTLRLDRWVLESLDAPIYPQNRYQLGLATAIVERYQLANRARVVRFSLANHWTGERTSDVLATHADLEQAANGYFLNARAR